MMDSGQKYFFRSFWRMPLIDFWKLFPEVNITYIYQETKCDDKAKLVSPTSNGCSHSYYVYYHKF